MLKEKIRVFIQKIEEIQKMSDWQKRRDALDVFFTEDVAALGLDEKDMSIKTNLFLMEIVKGSSSTERKKMALMSSSTL